MYAGLLSFNETLLFELQLNQGPYIYDIHEKCPIFAPLPLFLSVRMGQNWARALPTPGRRNMGYQPPPPPHSSPLVFLQRIVLERI